MFITPFISSPFTDFANLLGPKHRHASNDYACAKIEEKLWNCMDAYGTLKASHKCAELLYDINECNTHTAQMQRAKAMMKERMKQYREGKLSRPFEEHPPLDSYLGF